MTFAIRQDECFFCMDVRDDLDFDWCRCCGFGYVPELHEVKERRRDEMIEREVRCMRRVERALPFVSIPFVLLLIWALV